MECDRSHDAISRLRDCLLQLETGKITEKKDQIVKLQKLLRSPNILEFLDANTANKKRDYRDWSDGITWGKLFRRVVLYVNSEADRIQEREEAAESPSRAVIDNRTKEKQACSAFFKYVVKVIISREQHTVYQDIWQHIMEVMADSFKMSAFGPDYTNVLLKNILLNPQICLRISIPSYEKMIKRYARLSENPPGGWDRSLLVQVFYHLLLATYNQCDIAPQPLFNFFINMFGSVKGEKASKYHEYLLKALILVCRNSALSCQVQLCNLGESILSPLMQLWKKSTDAIKELILEFILLQFTLHHPQGCVDSQLDVFAENSSIWRSSLTNLYHLVIKELNDICERTKYSSSKDLTLHPYFIAVAVEVCAQVFQDTCSTIEVTQIPSTYESSQACKKRRVDVSFKVFLDAILSFSSFELIPWCQLMTAFLRKYPKIISLGDIASIINCLLEKHHSCKQIEVKTSLLTSCCAAVEAFCVVQKSGASENVHAVNCDWWRLWELAVKCVSLMHQCHEEGHKLLSTMLLNKLITPKAEFFSLYCAGSNNKPSRASVTTLTIYMHYFPLPSVINTVQNVGLGGKDSFRYQLLNWLFATDDNDDTDSFVGYLCSLNVDVPTANLTSSLLASICLQDYKPLLSTCLPFLLVSNNVSDPIEWISNLRQDLMYITFNLPFIDYNKVSSTDNFAPVFSCSNLLMSVWQKMDELLQNVCAKIFDTSVVSKAILDGHAVHIKLGCIVLLLIKQLVLVDALGKNELVSLPLTIQIKNLLNVSMEQIHCRDSCLQQPTCSTKGDSRIEILKFLATIVDISIQGNESSSRLHAMAIAEWLAVLIPTELGTILFKTINTNIHEKQTASASNSTPKKQVTRRNRYLSQADVDNDEFLCPSTSTRRVENCSVDNDLDLMDDDDDLINSTFNGGSNGDNQQSSNTLEFQLHCVEAIDSLLKLNIFIQPSGFEASTYIEQFLRIIDATIQHTQKTENVTLILKILKSLLKLPNLNIKAVEHVLNVIKSLLNKHCKNRVVCLKIIHLFESTYPHIFTSVHSSPVKLVKTHLLHLLLVLWKKEQKEQLAVDVSIALANALCQLIKVDDNIQWINESDKDALGEGEHMKKSLLVLFQCQRLRVRLIMASHLSIFFSDPNNTSISTEEQVKMLEKNCKESVTYLKDFESKNVQAQHVVQDEKLNFSTSLLYLLCNGYIFGDNFCRKHVLFFIFKLVKDNIISETLAIKALLQIEHFLKYKRLRDLVDHDIIYILHQWIEMKYSIKDFPWKLLELSSQQQFFQLCYEKLVPIYVYHSDIQSIKYLASAVDLDIEEVIVMCFPSVLARVISWIAIDPKCPSAQRCLAFIEEHVAKESLTTTLESSVGEIFVALLHYVKESHDSIEMPQANCHCLAYISPQDFSRSIELYQKRIDVKRPFVQFLCSKQDSLQNILLSVHTSLLKSHVLDEQMHALLMYSVLLNHLEPHFTSCLRKFIPFIVTEFVYSLINFIIKNGQTSDSEVLERNITLIHSMCECVLPVSQADIGKVLPFIVSRLIPLVSESSFGKQVHRLLTYLIVDHSEELEKYIVLLDPFPEMPQFSNMKMVHKNLMYKNGPYSLEMELEHFNKSFHATGRSTADGIQHLRQQLRAKQKELFKMIIDLQEKNLFSEDIKNRQLHQLICTLVFLCTPGNVEKEIQLEAGCCLGEIGPVDLSTIILHSSNGEMEITGVNKTTSSCLYQEYNHILKLLSDYLKDPRIHIKTVATDVLKNVFRTKTAQEMISCKDGSWLEYLYPFYCNIEADDFMDESYDIFMEQINQASLWVPKEGDHSTWLCNLVSAVLESGSTGDMLFQQLIPICKEEPTFCGQILPYLIRSVVFRDDEILSSIISTHMSTFFSKLSEELEKQPTSLSSTPITPSLSPVPFYACKASVQTMLSVVNYLRLQDNRCIPPNVCHNCWTGLDLNYLLVAQAAQYCSAHFSAILYAELWWNSVREKNIVSPERDVYSFDSSQELHSACSPMSVLNAQNDDGVQLMHKIVLEAYSSIGDPDGIHGCIEIATNMQSVLLSHYTVEKKWNSLLNLYDTGDYNPGILKALKNCSLNHILKKYIESQTLSGREPSPQTIEYQYECAWKLNQWDESLPDSENPGFQESFYKSLDCLKNQNKAGFLKHLELSRFIEFENLSHTSLESLMCILPMLSHLQMLVMMEDYANVTFNASAIVEVSAKWAEQIKIPCADFEFLEPVSWLQCNLLKQHLIHTAAQDAVAKNYVKCLLQHCIRARQESYLEAASNAINILKDSSLGSDHEMLVWQVEEAKILWAKNEPLIANHILASVLNSMEKIIEGCSSDKELIVEYARTLTLKGKWSGETCSENSTAIMQNYLQKAIDVLEKVCPSREDMHSSDAYLAVARYADNQYQSIINYKNSTAYQAKLELMAESRIHTQKLKQTSTLTADQSKTVVILVRQHNIDDQELKNLDVEQEKFLMKAVSGYLTCLRQTDIYDLWIFRLTALWFHNLNNKNINDIIHAKVAGMEKYKFLPLMYQLAARMGSYGNKQFSKVLGQLIKDIALDHPHHALPIILSMSNADKDPSEARTPLKKGAVAEDTVGKERIAAAKILVEELQKTKHRNLIKNLSELCDAYISLAYMPVNPKQKTGIIPRDMKIVKLKRMDDVPVITEVVKVDRSCQYQNVVGIRSFDNELRFCGGINVPKVIKCLGVDGVKREQLVKSRDDLRQDAVMQQVFSLVNCLLKENNETKRRKLSIRTYKVIPLSRRSGVLQWCEGTQVLSQYLIGPNPAGGAHKKYYSNFWTPLECQKQMKNSAAKTLEERRKTFDKICKNFPPVFRYFFLENFPDPSAWFERKQCYTKSVAANSIVGYILGLGDRHVNNILVDKRTAEVVHIDFGIAFEKGKILATPETVPFRLTRDIVDGMGFIGLEGVFKRCSEKTMEVMRNSHDILLTILEVLLHDPLYEWHVPVTNSSATPMKYGSSGSSKSIPEQEVNKLAERALMRLKQKLQGLEKGVTLSVSGQVNMLIQQARDPNNLCRLYAGWQPYL